MTRIEQMIKDLCPQGVEWKSLGEVCEIRTGKGITQSDANEGGEYPIISGGIQPMGYYHLKNRDANTITISRVGANAGFVNFIKEDFYLNDKCFTTIPKGDNAELFDIKFLYYYLKNNEETIRGMQSEGGVPTINTQKVGSIEIPIPPLEIQKKIVECLDKFSALAAELQAELQKRRTQYEFYRTRLLTPPQTISPEGSTDERKWEWKTLGEISYSIKTGLNPRKFFKLNTEDAQNYYITIREMQNNHLITSDKTDMINDEALKLCLRRSNIKKDDLLFSGTGTIGQMYVVTETPTNWAIKEGIYVIKPKTEQVLTKFLYYILGSDSVRKSINDKVAGGIVKSIPMKELANISIPLPSLAEQERIVTLLDKFEALTTSLSDGIPAEQAAQQKRYEYYRDLLLTFDRKAV